MEAEDFLPPSKVPAVPTQPVGPVAAGQQAAALAPDASADAPMATAVPLAVACEPLEAARYAGGIHVSHASAVQEATQPEGRERRYELVPGLWAQLSGDAVVEVTPVDDDGSSAGACHELTARAKFATVGDCLFVGEGLSLRATIVPTPAREGGAFVVRDLRVSLGGLAVDPLADRDRVASFRDRFGCGSSQERSVREVGGSKPSKNPVRNLPSRRLSQQQWGEFLRNVKEDVRVSETEEQNGAAAGEDSIRSQPSDADEKSAPHWHPEPPEDVPIPRAKVRAMKCKMANDASLDFPDCEGSEGCTLRTMAEYYSQAVINEMDLLSGARADIGARAVASDVTGVGGSLMGAAVGGLVLGPAGFLAGSFVWGKIGRKHVGATGGLMLFGPIGLVAGACMGPSARNSQENEKKPAATALVNSSGKESVRDMAKSHIASNKYEYAGSAGVIAGATAGSVLGPVGMVTGAVAGAVSSRKLVEKGGGLTNRMVERGKESRGAKKGEGYRFGDFTRGILLGRKKNVSAN